MNDSIKIKTKKPSGYITASAYVLSTRTYNLATEFSRMIEKVHRLYPKENSATKAEILGITPRVMRKMINQWGISVTTVRKQRS